MSRRVNRACETVGHVRAGVRVVTSALLGGRMGCAACRAVECARGHVLVATMLRHRQCIFRLRPWCHLSLESATASRRASAVLLRTHLSLSVSPGPETALTYTGHDSDGRHRRMRVRARASGSALHPACISSERASPRSRSAGLPSLYGASAKVAQDSLGLRVVRPHRCQHQLVRALKEPARNVGAAQGAVGDAQVG